MSALEDTVNKTATPAAALRGESYLTKILQLMCSVRLGVTLLISLCVLSFVGMAVMQDNVQGFQNYYASLSPAQREWLGYFDLFNIYQSWYYRALLAILSLNIVLASVDRFPLAWSYISRPSLTVPVRWLRERSPVLEFESAGSKAATVERLRDAFRRAGFRKPVVSEKNGRTYIFAQAHAWNRLGAYAVHAGLLIILFGGFVTSWLARTGSMTVAPGRVASTMTETAFELDRPREVEVMLPFRVDCLDIEQKLVRPDGPLSSGNTRDWITRFTITDDTGTHTAEVSMNRPFDHRGYRFFQAGSTVSGDARSVKIRAFKADGSVQELVIPRTGSAALADGTLVAYKDFRANLRMGREFLNEDTMDYGNPAAILEVAPPSGESQLVHALGPETVPVPGITDQAAGYTFLLAGFERSASGHILSVQRDPGVPFIYAGAALLTVALAGVFFFSHRRVWSVIEEKPDGTIGIIIAGHTNRDNEALEAKVRKIGELYKNR